MDMDGGVDYERYQKSEYLETGVLSTLMDMDGGVDYERYQKSEYLETGAGFEGN